jgi:TetR/AcrR family transcriptional repressor of nem operon
MNMIAGTAEKIRNVPHDLIATRGYADFSDADVAELVGVRKASIHHHFSSKLDLVVATLREHRANVLLATSRLTENVTDPFQRLQLYIQHWEGCIRSNKRPICIAVLLSSELPSLPVEIQPEVQAHFKDLANWVRSTLKEGFKHRSIRLPQTVESETRSFVALVHGAMFSARALDSPEVSGLITKNALNRIHAHA